MDRLNDWYHRLSKCLECWQKLCWEIKGDGKRQTALLATVYSPNTPAARGWSQEPGTQPGPPMWRQESNYIRHHCCSPGAPRAGSRSQCWARNPPCSDVGCRRARSHLTHEATQLPQFHLYLHFRMNFWKFPRIINVILWQRHHLLAIECTSLKILSRHAPLLTNRTCFSVFSLIIW